MHETLMKALQQSRFDSENAQRGEVAKKSLLIRLEELKKETERNAVPIDGYAPPEKGRRQI
jgi:hypothetical protein